MKDYASLSLWHNTVGESLKPRVPLTSAEAASRWDVVIMGAGYTGLWAALALVRTDPQLKVLVLDKDIAGYGASGRNGGWVSALFPTSTQALIARHGEEGARALREAMVGAVDSVGVYAHDLDIECDFVKGGTTTLARNTIQLTRAHQAIAQAQLLGVDQLSWQEPHETLQATSVRGAVHDPACARVHPAKLVRGLARALDGSGVRIAELTEVLDYEPHKVITTRGTIACDIVVDAMEGYRSALAPTARHSLPLYSLMIATEPLSDAVFDDVGLEHGMTFADFRSLVIYGQRTADNRIAFGGRGAPYHFGSAISPQFDRVPRVFHALESTLKDMFPQVSRAAITHTWGGVLGVPRDWHSSVTFDSSSGIARAGGYVGDGVGLSHLAGFTVSDLITGTDSPRTHLPFVHHVSPLWEPEPLRYLGATAAIIGVALADRIESRTGRPSVVSRLIAPLTGH